MTGLERARATFDGLTDSPDPGIEGFLERAGRLIGPRYGLVHAVEWVDAPPRAPRIVWARARPADTTLILGRRALNDGNAAALDPRRALAKAAGESFERYAAAAVDPDRLRLGTYDDLAPGAVDPDDFALFTPEQYAEPGFRAAPFRRDTPAAWVDGWSLTRGQAGWVPAIFAWLPLHHPDGDPAFAALPRLVPAQVSSGLCAHTGRLRAILGGLLEVLERDGFMTWWGRGGGAPAIDLEDPRLSPWVRAARVPGYRLEVRLVTADIPIPVVVAVYRSVGPHRPFTVVGASAALDPVDATRGALEEAMLSLHGITAILEQDQREPQGEPRDLMDHVRHHGLRADLAAVTDAALRADRTLGLDDLPRAPAGTRADQLAWLVQTLADRGLEAWVVDLTTPDLEAAGVRVVRALIPGARPLDVDHTARHLGARRGLPRHPHPHPFP